MLEVGEQKVVWIKARPLCTDTGIEVAGGQEYRLEATGRWTDFYITCDAGGYRTPWWNPVLRLTESWRRVPNADWFTLIGAVVDGSHRYEFPIGTGTTTVFPMGGRLCYFANDVPGAYWNNFGAVQLAVRRQA